MNRPNQNLRVAFVLVNWNTRDLLLQCLKRLREPSKTLTSEVVVVDNASADGSAAAVGRDFPDITLYCNETNVGFARGVNQGIRSTRAPIICLLNPDLEIDPDALIRCLEIVESDSTIGALGPLLLDGSGDVWRYPNRYPTFAGMIRDALLPFASTGETTNKVGNGNLIEADWLAGACLFLQRRALDEVGLLDERFFLYKEDVDLCLRLRQGGFKVVRNDAVELCHLVAQSTRRHPGPEADQAHVEGFRSTVLYTRKHHGRTAALIVTLAIRISLLIRMTKAALLTLVTGRHAERRKVAWMSQALFSLDRERRDLAADVGEAA